MQRYCLNSFFPRSFLMLMVLCASMMVLQGCTEHYDARAPYIDDTYPIAMAVEKIQVFGRKPENAPSPLPVSPHNLAAEWFEKRLTATGQNGARLEVDVVKSETARNKRATHTDFYSYTTVLELELKLYESTDRLARATSNATIRVTRELEKDASRPEYEMFFAEMSRAVADRLERNIPTQLETYFGNYLMQP